MGQGITTVIRKLADGEDGRLVSQKTIFPQSKLRLFLYREMGGVSTVTHCHLLGGRVHYHADQWLSRATKSCSLTVALVQLSMSIPQSRGQRGNDFSGYFLPNMGDEEVIMEWN